MVASDNAVQTRSVRPRRWWSRVLDGDRIWGSVEIWPDRDGTQRCRLVVFPPGITAAQRRRLRMWRTWPAWGSVLWLLSEAYYSDRLASWESIATSTIVWLAAGAISAALAGRLRSQVRATTSTVIGEHLHRWSERGCTQLEVVVRVLNTADAMREAGRLSAVEHEAVWWYAYRKLGADRAQQAA